MGTTHQFALPDVGEGLTEAEVVTWLVAAGDVVAVNDPVVEVETAKSIVELPSPYAGVVAGLLVEEGTTVPVGTPLIAVDDLDAAPAGQGGSGVEGGPVEAVVEHLAEHPAEHPAERSAVLVGYGPRSGAATTTRRRRHSAPTTPAPTTPAPTTSARTARAAAPAPAATPARASVLAKPPVRAMARDLGIDLDAVTPSGAGGVVTREDLLAHTAAPPAVPPATPVPAASAVPPVTAPDRTTSRPTTAQSAAESAAAAASSAVRGPGSRPARPVGVLDLEARETRVPVRGVRRATAEQMVASAFTAPHATAFTTVDVSRTVKLLERLRADRDFRDVHVSPLLMVCRAVCLAVARHPGINASWDEVAQEIVLKHYVNLGIAVATPRGLLVPSVKDADRMPLHRLALALTELVRTSRDGRSTPADLSGSTISITNIGVFGVDSGTPILNPGEAAILCVGAVKQRPWVHKGKIKPRWVVDLSVSFDHRLVDGDLGSQFLADVAAVLERPDTAIRWG